MRLLLSRHGRSTKAALAAYKQRGGKLGAQLPQCRNNLKQKARIRGAKAAGQSHAKRANDAYGDLYSWIVDYRDRGLTYQEIADKLNSKGHTTRRGMDWNPTQVMRVIKRANMLSVA